MFRLLPCLMMTTAGRSPSRRWWCSSARSGATWPRARRWGSSGNTNIMSRENCDDVSVFRQADTDNNGVIDKEEFRQLWGAVRCSGGGEVSGVKLRWRVCLNKILRVYYYFHIFKSVFWKFFFSRFFFLSSLVQNWIQEVSILYIEPQSYSIVCVVCYQSWVSSI